MPSCNCFIIRSEFSTKMPLSEWLFLKESTSLKNHDFRASNSPITGSLSFNNSSLKLILNDSLHCLWPSEYWAPFGKGTQIRVPTSFICTEWHFINFSRSSSKRSLVPHCLRILILNEKLPLYHVYCSVLEFLLRQKWDFPNLSLLLYGKLLSNREFLQKRGYC